MANFFTSENDLKSWIKNKKSAEDACLLLLTVTGNEHEQDIIDTCNSIYSPSKFEDEKSALRVLFSILKKYNLVSGQKRKDLKMSDNKKNNKEFIKEAQTMRSGLYNNMPLRVCPKLPYSCGKKLISTWNCREHCLDSLVLDEDPTKVYCLETMWRRHVMDKFSREFKNNDGEWVGGYINNKFYKFPDAGTPSNPNVPRDHGNTMQLKNEERTRTPRESQYSTEAQLEKQRGIEPIFHSAKQNGLITKISSKSLDLQNDYGKKTDDEIYNIFDDMIEMKQVGINPKDILIQCSNHYKISIEKASKIYHCAMRQLSRYDSKLYSYANNNKNIKTSINKITSSVFIVPENNFISGILPNKKEINLHPGTVLTPTNVSNKFIINTLNSNNQVGNTDLVGEEVEIKNPSALVVLEGDQAEITKDMLDLEGNYIKDNKLTFEDPYPLNKSNLEEEVEDNDMNF